MSSCHIRSARWVAVLVAEGVVLTVALASAMARVAVEARVVVAEDLAADLLVAAAAL